MLKKYYKNYDCYRENKKKLCIYSNFGLIHTDMPSSSTDIKMNIMIKI